MPPKGWRGGGGGSGASKDARRQLPHPAQGRVEGQGGPPGPACLGHPWVLTPGRRGGHRDTFSLQLVCTILQLWAAHRAPRFTCEGVVPCILGGNTNSFDPYLSQGTCVRGYPALDPILWGKPGSQAPLSPSAAEVPWLPSREHPQALKIKANKREFAETERGGCVCYKERKKNHGVRATQGSICSTARQYSPSPHHSISRMGGSQLPPSYQGQFGLSDQPQSGFTPRRGAGAGVRTFLLRSHLSAAKRKKPAPETQETFSNRTLFLTSFGSVCGCKLSQETLSTG